MSTISTQEQYIKKEVLSKCWAYLNDNFHKFSDTNKIKISLELSKKDMPTVIEGDGIAQRNITNINYPKDWKPKEERIGIKSEAVSSGLLP